MSNVSEIFLDTMGIVEAIVPDMTRDRMLAI